MDRTLDDLPILTVDEVDSGLARAIDEAGCCVIADAVEPATMDAIASDLAAFQAQASIGASDFEGHRTRRLGAPLPRSATFQSIAMHPAVMAAGDLVLGHASSWRFSAAEYIEIGPGETGQRIHRDQWKYDMVDFEFDVELNGMWAITDLCTTVAATTPLMSGEVVCRCNMRSVGSRSRRTSSSSVHQARSVIGPMTFCDSLATPRLATDLATGVTVRTRSQRSFLIVISNGAGPPSDPRERQRLRRA